MSRLQRNVRTRMSNSRSGPPPKITVILCGAYEYTAASSATYGELPVKLNSPRDFLGSTSTISASYFTHYASIYKYYRVIASKIVAKARLSSTSGTPTPTAMHGDLAVSPSPQSPAYIDFKQAMAAKWAKWSTYGGEQRAAVTLQCTMKQLVGNSFGNSGYYRTLVSSDPSDAWHWIVSFQSRVYTNVNVEVDVQVWYTVEFSDLQVAVTLLTKYQDLAYRANCYEIARMAERQLAESKAETKRVEREKAEFDELSKQLNVLLTEPELVSVPDPPSVKSLKLKLERKI